MGVLYLFLAVLGLCCWVWAFSSCREQGYSFVAVGSLSLLWVLLLWSKGLVYVASVVVVHGLSCLAVCEVSFLVSFQARDQTCVPCIGRWILNHWTIREVQIKANFFFLFFFWLCHMVCRILVPWPGVKPVTPTVEFQFRSLSRVWLFATPWTAAHQTSLSITNSWNLLKLTSIESVISSNHLMLCCPLLLPPSIFPSIRVFSDKSVLHSRWPKYWSFISISVLPMKILDWFPLRWTGWISLQSEGLSSIFSSTTVQKNQFFHTQVSL